VEYIPIYGKVVPALGVSEMEKPKKHKKNDNRTKGSEMMAKILGMNRI
jgi:hypothetical protein